MREKLSSGQTSSVTFVPSLSFPGIFTPCYRLLFVPSCSLEFHNPHYLSGHVPLECSIDISRPNLNSSFPGNHFFRLSRVKKVLLFPSLGFRNQELNVSPSQDAYSTVVTRLVSMGLKKCALLPPEENDRTTGQTLKSVFRGLRPYRDRHHRTH